MTDKIENQPASEHFSLNVDAKPQEDVRVDVKKAEEVLDIYHDRETRSVAGVGIAERKVLESLLGKSFSDRLRDADAGLIYRSLLGLPKSADANSFVWNVISDPASVRSTLKAIQDVQAFSKQTMIISDKIGANNHFREMIEKIDATKDFPLHQLVSKFDENVKGLSNFVERVQHLRDRAQSVFMVDDLSVEAMLTIFAASHSIIASEDFIHDTIAISKYPQGDILEKLEISRGIVVAASNDVKRLCGVAPVLFSETVLEGAIRSVKNFRPGDFVFVIESLGGSLEGEENIENTIKAFIDYIEAYVSMKNEIISWGYSADEISALISYALIQRHLRTAAEELGMDFSRIEIFLRLRNPDEKTEEALHAHRNQVLQFFREISSDGISGRLIAVCDNKQTLLSQVYDTIYRATIEREYFLQVGKRIIEVYPDVSIREVLDVIGQEAELRKANDAVRKLGVHNGDDLEKLEKHVQWAINANSLPVPSGAIAKLIESRGALLPPRT